MGSGNRINMANAGPTTTIAIPSGIAKVKSTRSDLKRRQEGKRRKIKGRLKPRSKELMGKLANQGWV